MPIDHAPPHFDWPPFHAPVQWIAVSLPQRAKLFKAGVGRDEARRGRSETQVQIRKEKKEERLNQRRRKGAAGDNPAGFTFGSIPEGGAPAAGNSAAADPAAHMRVSLYDKNSFMWFLCVGRGCCGLGRWLRPNTSFVLVLQLFLYVKFCENISKAVDSITGVFYIM